LPGVSPPLGFFDPLLYTATTVAEVKRMREAEARLLCHPHRIIIRDAF
jgi:hypothetical protein